MNYALLMKGLGLKWRDINVREIDDLFAFFQSKGVNCLRVRIWFGESGPSRLSYALESFIYVQLIFYIMGQLHHSNIILQR
jgi:hypothetical protein